MGDILGSFSTGYQTGQAAYKAEQEKKAKAAREAAEFNLKLASESRLLTGAAEESWGKIESAINDPNWDVSRLPQVLQAAATHDKTYGKIWQGGKATERVMEALHMNKVKAAVPRTPTDLGNTVEINADDPMRGYATTEQINHAEKLQMEMATRGISRHLMDAATSVIESKDGSMMEPAVAYKNLMDWQADVIENGYNGQPVDAKVVDDVLDQVREQMGKVYQGIADGIGKGKEVRERVDQVGKEASTWFRGLLQLDKGEGALGTDLFATRTALLLKMEQEGQMWAAMGYPLSYIKGEVIARHMDEMGGLQLDVKQPQYAGVLTMAGAPVQARNAVAKAFDNDVFTNEEMVSPVYNRDTGEMWMIDKSNPENSIKVYDAKTGMAFGNPSAPPTVEGPPKGYKAPKVETTREPKPPKPPKVEEPKAPEVPIEQLLAKSPGDLTGPELSRVMKNMTGPDFVAWMQGKYAPKER